MKLCFPVAKHEGMQSKVYNHFGSSPMFVVVDTDEMEANILGNGDLNHVHGACNPAKALGGKRIDAVIVGGIGQGAVRGLAMQGIEVFLAAGATVAENVALFQDGKLDKVMSGFCESGHSHGHDHGHGDHGDHGGGCGCSH